VLSSAARQELEETVRRWQAAEQRLYPAVMAWPEAYERYVGLVRVIADELGSVRDTESLAKAYLEGTSLASAAARRHRIPTDGLDLELAIGAAFCIRCREIVAEGRREDAARKVEEAQAQGQSWVAIQETKPWLQIPFPPWRRIEMHLPEGTGLHMWVEESLEAAGVEYGVELVRLDPQTGQWLADQPVLDRRTFLEHDAWKQAVEELRAKCERSVVSEL
jgi:hypothetical protein